MLNQIAGLEALLSQAEGKPLAMVSLARHFCAAGRKSIALDLCRRALDLASDDGEIRVIVAEVISAGVPDWHFAMIRDQARNDAFDTALRRAVRSDNKVLEIGTGTGILAMMAARAGAAQVVTCEVDPAIAEVAREIIARNGYAARVHVIAKHSTALDRDADLDGPADILVSEVFDNSLLGEDVLNVTRHAVQHLLKPGGKVIPRAGCIRVALAHLAEADTDRMGIRSGFDLTPFNRLARPFRRVQIGDRRLSLKSEPADLFRFDFSCRSRHSSNHGSVVLTTMDGPINGFAQWIALDIDEDSVYENRPVPGGSSAWAALFYLLPHPVENVPGQRITVSGSHDARSVRLWADLGTC